MNIAGLDVATTSGRCVCRLDERTNSGEHVFYASSFRPKVKRPFELARGAVSFPYEGKLLHEWRDDTRAWLIAEKVEILAFETPLKSNVSVKKTRMNSDPGWGAGQSFTVENSGATNFGTIFRIYSLIGHLVDLCDRLNIECREVHQATWRKSFFGSVSPPKGVDRSKWWKDQALRQVRLLGIEVPNHDAAESVGVCWWLRGQLDQRFNTRAEDLFRKTA